MIENGKPHQADIATDSSAQTDLEVALILEAYLSDLKAGRPGDPERLIATHPHIAQELRACLEILYVPIPEPEGSVDSDLDPTLSGSSPVARPDCLTTIWGTTPIPPVVLLSEPDGAELQPVVRRAGHPTSIGRYQVLGEIARGGMGAVLRARDADLGRDLALKILLDRHRDKPALLHRFVEEAQIGGQLQHPGIVPVYEMGAFGDSRPFLAMKLVHGRTFAVLLAERPQPAQDLPRFLAIFEQVCQTIAYAHSRRVIHRDLKPSNVMVGSFGEVQVMDWGLAKVLPEGGVADERLRADGVQPLTEIRTVRTEGSGSESEAGSVLGTPAYMAPEQARGEVELLDERADVFGLGAILCEILTGSPAFVATSRARIQLMAASGDLTDAWARLAACGADDELTSLARDCLASLPADRPRDAGIVARRMTAYTASVQERLRTAELARVEALARAEEEVKQRRLANLLAEAAQAQALEERRRRRLQVSLASSLLALVVLGGTGGLWYVQERQKQSARVALLMSEADLLRRQAREHPEDQARWLAATEAVKRVEVALGGSTGLADNQALESLRAEVQEGTQSAESDQRLLETLNDIRSASAEDQNGPTTDTAYGEAFHSAGMDIDVLEPVEAGARIRRRPESVARSVVAALDHWCVVRMDLDNQGSGWKRLLAASRAADPDPDRDLFRASLLIEDLKERLERVRPLTAKVDAGSWAPASLVLLAQVLSGAGDGDGAVAVLRKASGLYPSDALLHFVLGSILEKGNPPQPEESIRAYSIARALRPAMSHELAHALENRGRGREAELVFRDLIRLRPDDVLHLTCFAETLKELGRSAEAKPLLDQAIALGRSRLQTRRSDSIAHFELARALKARDKFDEAVAEYREAIRLKPVYAESHVNLGYALWSQGKFDEAVAELRESVFNRPLNPRAHDNLAIALMGQGKIDEAANEAREAIRLNPVDAGALNNLGGILHAQGKYHEALAAFREALKIRPNFAIAHLNLGIVLMSQNKPDEAIEEWREAVRIKPDYAEAYLKLADVLQGRGRLEEACFIFQTVVRLEPGNFKVRNNFGFALESLGRINEALEQFREASRIEPTEPLIHVNIAMIFERQGKLEDAIAEYQEAVRLRPDDASYRNNFGIELQKGGKLNEAIAQYSEAIRLNPENATYHGNLGMVLRELGKFDEAVIEFRTATRLIPDDSGLRVKLGSALKAQGKFDESIREYHQAIQLQPDHPEAHFNLANALSDQGKLDDAIDEFREAIRFKPNDAGPHNNLGNILKQQGKLEQAGNEYREAIRLDPMFAEAWLNLGNVADKLGQPEQAVEIYRETIRIKPDLAVAHYNLANILAAMGKPSDATAEFREAIRLNPDLAEAHCNLAFNLIRSGEHVEALKEMRLGHELGSKDPHWPYPSADWVRQFEQIAALFDRLPAIIEGTDKPRNFGEGITFGQWCFDKSLYVTVVRLWSETIASDPQRANDRQSQLRYNAACAAALAAAGKGKEAPQPDEGAKAGFRKQALDWLVVEIGLWSKLADHADPQTRDAIRQTLDHWKVDGDLTTIRDEAALAKLPADERDRFKALWAEVEAVLKKVKGG